MLALDSCVQGTLAPSIDAATARVLDRIGISLVRVAAAGCCGALPYHLSGIERGLALARRNIDAWWPHVDRDIEAIVITASGCGTMVADYGHLLRNDPDYAERAARISSLAKDVSEVVAAEKVALANAFAGRKQRGETLAFHSPCSLQHGLKVKGVVESILRDAGFTLTAVPDGHLCCGSAGTYSILQSELSGQLLRNKVAALESGSPEVIATANIGCLMHIQSGTARPVRHWIEILDASGTVVRTFSSDPNAQRSPVNRRGAPVQQPTGIPRVSPLWQTTPQPLPATAGMHRAVWNPLRERPRGAPPADEGGPLDTRYTGNFTARLTVNGKVFTQPFSVKPDPRGMRA